MGKSKKTKNLTIPQLFNKVVERFPDHIALNTAAGEGYKERTNDEHWERVTWAEYSKHARSVAKSLIALEMPVGRCNSIIGFNSAKWFYSGIGTILAGGVMTGVYTTSSSEMCGYISGHCDSFVVFAENKAHLTKYLDARAQLPQLRLIVCFDDDEPLVKEHKDGVMGWKSFIKLGRKIDDEAVDARCNALKPDDLANIIYTSGTTGMPKGVMLSHQNVTWTVQALGKALALNENDRVVSYLPLSHIAEQAVSLWGPMQFGYSTFFARPDVLTTELGAFLVAVRPTVFLGVPRVWEKMASLIQMKGAQTKGLKKKVATWAKDKSLKANMNLQEGKKPPSMSGTASKVMQKVKKAVGLDQCRLAFTGAAPISRDTLRYFLSLDMIIYEIYGMSECCGPETINLPGFDGEGVPMFKTGTCGRALPGTELKIAEDGEVCYRGPHIFMGYLKNPDATREALDDEGWLHSGDIGKVNKNGFLSITDRKKELIISAGGENIPPAQIELTFKANLMCVNQAVLYGDRQKFPVILFTLDPDMLKQRFGLKSVAKANKDEAFKTEFNKQFNAIAETITKAWAPKKFAILENQFAFEGPADQTELTPTMKMKRRIIYVKYLPEIKEIYGEDFNDDSFDKAKQADKSEAPKKKKKSKKDEQ
jgi:long-subunit acyl-CoA synthetase (AMP-forming)